MTKRAIKQLITQYLKQKKFKEISTGWIMCACPFSKWLHPDGDDKRYSFGISVKNGYNCFTCGVKGNILKLPKSLAKFTHEVPYDMIDFIRDNYEFEETEPLYSSYTTYDASILSKYEEAPEIFSLTKDDIRKWQIKIDRDNACLLFPVFDSEENLVAIKVRCLDKKLFYYLFNNSIKECGIWYGEHFKPEDTLALVEGERDAILLGRFIPTWACQGGISVKQIEKIKGVRVKRLILFFDNDTAGVEYLNKMRQALGGLLRLYVVKDYLGCKDPAELVEKDLISKVKFVRV